MKRRLLYLVTEDWYFYSHRLPMARAAKAAGFDVAVIANVTAHKEKIENEGIRVIPLSLDRRDLSPVRALGHIQKIAAIYRREKPDLVHHIAMKPVLYGSIAAMASGVPRVINAFAGLGYVFSDTGARARAIRAVLVTLFRLLLKRKGSWVLVQNGDDLETLRRYGLVVPARVRLIPGSGVDLEANAALPFPDAAPGIVCAFAGRMIGIKGLATLREAFIILGQRGVRAALWLCGAPDPGNPGSWTEAQLKEWAAPGGNVVWKGHCSDMRAIWAQAHVALQPSWGGEGVPKSLLEAAACGRALIASDVPGCRDVVRNGINGYLVPPRDAKALAARIEALAGDIALCMGMGMRSREFIEQSGMSAADVAAQAQSLYRDIIEEKITTNGHE